MSGRVFATLGFSVSLVLTVFVGFQVRAAVQLNGAGASFPYPIYSKWFSEYQKTNQGIRFNYRPIGSGGGVRQLIAGTVDFGASDVPLNSKEKSKLKNDVLQVPMVIGAVVLVYNLPELKQGLVLDGSTLADIFMGKVKKWNDPKIQALNPETSLPKQNIMVVRRADASGTTAVLTEYFSEISSEWKSSVGAGKSVKWKTGFGGKGNDGVAGVVKQTPGSIGYVELAYALTNNLAYASLKNASGQVVKAELNNISVSARQLAKKLSSGKAQELVGRISNSTEGQAYPITSLTYLLVPLGEKNQSARQELRKFISWALVQGDSMVQELHYAPLPEQLKQMVRNQVEAL
jgi:phosphate transport system substrate-binding protein